MKSTGGILYGSQKEGTMNLYINIESQAKMERMLQTQYTLGDIIKKKLKICPKDDY